MIKLNILRKIDIIVVYLTFQIFNKKVEMVKQIMRKISIKKCLLF
jgi:hypothetical protein